MAVWYGSPRICFLSNVSFHHPYPQSSILPIQTASPDPYTDIRGFCDYLKTVFTFRSVAWKLAQSISTSSTAAKAAAEASSPPSIHLKHSLMTISLYHISIFLSNDPSNPSLSFLHSFLLLDISLYTLLLLLPCPCNMSTHHLYPF